MSYLELIKLALPEAVVVITALVVLAVGLTTSRRTGTTCSSIAVLGLTGAIGAVLMLPRNANLFGGMLVITPLTSLFKIICLALAFFTICLVRSEKSLRHPGEYLAIILFATVGLMLGAVRTGRMTTWRLFRLPWKYQTSLFFPLIL